MIFTKDLKLKGMVDMIEWGYAFLLVVLPIAFNFWLNSENIFELPKQFIFKIVLLYLLVLFFGYLISERRLPVFKSKAIYYLSGSLLTLFIVNIFFSHEPLLSFVGKYGREQGILSLLHYLLFFVLSLFLLPLIDNWRRLWLALLSGSWIVMIYGYLQHFGLDPIAWVSEARIFSTLGQPNFYGYYLALLIPLSLYYLMAETDKRLKILAIVTLISQIISLFLTMSRGAMLGFLAVVVFLALLYLWKEQKIKQFLAATIFVCVMGAGLIAGQSWVRNFDSQSHLVNRAISAFDVSSVSANIRFEFWQAAWQIWQTASWQEKVFGYGKEYQHRLYYHYYEPDWGYLDKANRIPDRAHNLIIDIWLEFGLLGLFVFVAFGLYIFWVGSQALSRLRKEGGGRFWLIAAAMSLMLAYFVSNMFGFPVTTHYVLYYFAAALTLIFSQGKDMKWLKLDVSGRNLRIAAVLFIVLYSLAFYMFSLRYALADLRMVQASTAESRGDYKKAVLLAHESQSLYSLNINFRSENLRIMSRGLAVQPKAVEKDKLLDRSQENFTFWQSNKERKDLAQHLARFYSLAGKAVDKKYFDRAENIYQELLSEEPAFDYLYADYGSFLILQSKKMRAKTYIKKAIELLPDPEKQPVPFNEQVVNIKEEYHRLLNL